MLVLKKVPKVFVIIICVFTVIAMSMFLKMSSDLNNLEYHKVAINEVEDGIYQGNAETTLVKVGVEVEVMSHEIIRIDTSKHENGLGIEAGNIIDEIVSMNSYKVDAISGATASSNVIISAANDALSKGKK